MAPDSPESPSKKRNHHDHPRRDQPLFASRHPRLTLQQPPDFLTESVNTSRNTSYIPSPSPEKSPTRESLRAKPRQARDRRPFKSASSNSHIDDENRSPSSSKSQRLLDYPQPAHKSRSSQITGRTPSKSSARPATPAKSPARTRTPSQPRGRSLIPESPANSESSPGRGYAEAYQRIVEEENLAQEDSIEDMDLEDLAYSRDDVSQELDPLRKKHTNSSTSSKSLRASRKASPKVSTGDEHIVEETGKDNTAIDQESVSDMAPTENDTYTSAGSGSSQYARDMQRLNHALKGSGQAFRKARVGTKTGLTTQNLRRSNGSVESLESASSSKSLSQIGSDPSVNVPKAWGRKAEPSKDWLNRINSRSGKFTGDSPKRSPTGDQLIAESTRRNSEGLINKWIAAADVPLPDSSPLVNGSSQGSTPRTSIQRNTPISRKPKWDFVEDDFTGRSLQVSESPPLRIRNAALDSMRDREIEILERRAVTTNRLGELRERASNPQLLPYEMDRRSSDTSSPERLRQGKEDALEKVRRKSDTDKATPENSQDDLGEPIPDTPIVVFRNTSASSDSKSQEHPPISDQTSHRRGESDNLLKRLARVSSQSPSPARDHVEAEEQPKEQARIMEPERTPKATMPKIYEKTPVITGAWIEETPGPTPKISKPSTVLETPFVMGGWIETPLPSGGRGPPMPTPSDPDDNRQLGSNRLGAADLITKLNTSTPRPQLKSQEPLKYTGPPLPKSALEEIINDAKSGKLNDTRPDLDSAEEPTLHLGDSTIQSLEDLIANDTDYSTLLATSQETSPLTPDPSPPSADSLPKSHEAPQDPQSYAQLLSRLTNLAPSIRASKRQLASLEQTVATTTTKPTEPVCNEAGEFHDFIWPCPRCHCPGRLPSLNVPTDLTTTIALPVPRLWSWRPNDWRPRLTRLGTLLFCIYAYLFAENWAQYVFHPLFLPPLYSSDAARQFRH